MVWIPGNNPVKEVFVFKIKRNLIQVITIMLMLALVFPIACAKAEFKLGSLEISPSQVAIGDVATVTVDLTNSGGAEGTYGVTLVINGISVETKDVTVPAETTKEVSFTVSKQDIGTYKIQIGDLTETLHVDFELSSLEISPNQIAIGDTATVMVELTNSGGVEGTYGITLVIDGVSMETKDVTMPGETTKEVSFNISKQNVGVYEIQVGDLSGTLDVVKPAEFQLSSLVVTPDKITPGHEVTATVDVRNISELEGNYSCAWLVDGITIKNEEVTLDGGETETVIFTFRPDEHGSCQVTVGDLTETVRVLKPAEFTVSSLLISPDETSANSPVIVSVDVANIGEAVGSYKLILLINGQTSSSKMVILNSKEKETVDFKITEGALGIHNIKINNLTGTLKVSTYEDDFSDPSSGWQTYSSERCDYGYQDGEFHFLMKEYGWMYWDFNKSLGQLQDFVYEVDAGEPNIYGECDYGVIFRAQPTDEANYYYFLIQSGVLYMVTKKVNGEWERLTKWETTGHIKKGSAANHIKVVCEGTEIEVYVNGHLLTTITDDTFTRGYVGMIAEARKADSRIVYDNMKISLLH